MESNIPGTTRTIDAALHASFASLDELTKCSIFLLPEVPQRLSLAHKNITVYGAYHDGHVSRASGWICAVAVTW
jgi:hypothetical protein